MISSSLVAIYDSFEDMYAALVYKGVTVSSADRKPNKVPQLTASIKGVSYPSPIPVSRSMTTTQKLTALQQIKSQIKQVIIDSAVVAGDDLTLYGDYIRSINVVNNLEIVCPNTIVGTSGLVAAVYNSLPVTAAWSISQGSQYATIDNTGELTIIADGNVTITATYNNVTVSKTIAVDYEEDTSTDTTVDEEGNITVTETIENPDGSTNISSTTTNTDGTSSTNETVVNSDGSSTSTTTNYDENGDPTTKENQSTDVSGNENTQHIEFDNDGNEVVTGYEIDTSQSSSGGEVVAGLDTGLIVFDGKGFEMNMVVNFKASENSSKCVWGALQHLSGSNYAGFNMVLSTTSRATLWGGRNSRIQAAGGVGTNLFSSKYWNLLNTYTSYQDYTISFTYLPANYGSNTENYPVCTITFSPIRTGSNFDLASPCNTDSSAATNIPETLDNATFTLGGNGVDSSHQMNNFTVKSFSVHKL